jgi:ferredoxin
VSAPDRLRLQVERIRCDGAGLCAELLPELISLDDWGYPILAPDAVPGTLRPLARQAVEACPVLALRLVPVPAAVEAR